MPDVIRAESECKPVGILGYDSARDVDLLQLHSRIPGIPPIPRRVDRPELRADHSFPESIEIGLTGRVFAEIVGIYISACDGIFANRPRKVDLPVVQRSFPEYPLGTDRWEG